MVEIGDTCPVCRLPVFSRHFPYFRGSMSLARDDERLKGSFLRN
jgi:hypothetical protein